MAERLAVKSKDAAATPLRRSPRFKTKNPNQTVSSSHPKPHSIQKSDLKSTPTSAKPRRRKVGKENRFAGKQTCSPHACEIVAEKDALLGSISARRRSPRLAKIGTASMAQDGACAVKKKGCMVTKLAVKKTCTQSACQTGSDNIVISGSVNGRRKLPRSAQVSTIKIERRKSPRLMSAETSHNSNVEFTKNSTRSSKSNKTTFTCRIDTCSPSVCPPNVRYKATKSNCMKEARENCSNGRRKSNRLATVPSDKLQESNCSEGGIVCVSQQCLRSMRENASEEVAILASKSPLPPNQRRSKRIGNQSDKITRKGYKPKYLEESDSDYEFEESPVGKKRKREESAETETPVEFANGELGSGLNGWTEEQEIALHNAFFLARPSPHFWNKVSKMVI
jgi:hypothetical protein